MKLIILDRDGVINVDSKDYIKSPNEWHAIGRSLEAIALLTSKGFTVAVATNQSGIARGYYTEQTLFDIHEKMHHAVREAGGVIDKVVYCPHGPNAGCDCRKPKAGLLKQLATHYGVSLNDVPVVGDSLRDIQSAQLIGARPCLVLTGNGVHTRDSHADALKNVDIADDLLDFVKRLIEM